ncbi:hypothetical protein BT96DRAFT_32880 [Gymnopus androsaceus JB14]|uniref:NACHT domain-containing protein n=1 Tax=Gymnopus androsaceus JB14 TaxID=1447944 RepID=A0A6A4HNA7_9AGAR|nr:hypothetical protein BT96DRAFT_32880 [Gymnopus androsaceus JB14]
MNLLIIVVKPEPTEPVIDSPAYHDVGIIRTRGIAFAAVYLLRPHFSFLSQSMAGFFPDSHHFRINGGNFLNNIRIERDLVIPVDQQYSMPSRDDNLARGRSEVDSWIGTTNSGASGVQRTIRSTGGARHAPYGASTPPILQGTGELPGRIRLSREHEPMTTINGGTFLSNNIQHQGESGINILHRAVALEALHDWAESFPQPRCHPETRTKMLKTLRDWSLQTDPRSRILWLYGPAGAGKSAIMQTVFRELQNEGRLGACFFFKRGHATRGNAKTLFSTIAYQLAIGDDCLKASISKIMEANPSIVARSMEIQLQKLISEPCHLHNNHSLDPLLILIDGLDECEGHDVHLEILRAMRESFKRYPLPLRVIIASRPESHIREMFESSVYHGYCCPFNVMQSYEDVRKYLQDEFARIHSKHQDTLAAIPFPWPSRTILDELVQKSSGYFIYASTIVKFIDDKNYRPTERLAIVTGQSNTESDSAFDALDQLYMTILSTAPRRSELIPILCALANVVLDPCALDQIFQMENGEARLLLRSLHSVIEVPSKESNKQKISVHHASFYNFLNDSKRSRDFYVGSECHRMDLACSLLELFTAGYQGSFLDEDDCGRYIPTRI